MKLYFTFGVDGNCLPEDGVIEIEKITDIKSVKYDLTERVGDKYQIIGSKANKAIANALAYRFGIDVELPEKKESFKLEVGDWMITLESSLDVESKKHSYDTKSIACADFTFKYWHVIK